MNTEVVLLFSVTSIICSYRSRIRTTLFVWNVCGVIGIWSQMSTLFPCQMGHKIKTDCIHSNRNPFMTIEYVSKVIFCSCSHTYYLILILFLSLLLYSEPEIKAMQKKITSCTVVPRSFYIMDYKNEMDRRTCNSIKLNTRNDRKIPSSKKIMHEFN